MAFTLNRLGLADLDTGNVNDSVSTTEERELFQKKYLTEVLAAFDERNVMQRLHRIRQIANAKSATFPATWKTDASYHIPGNDLTGSQSVGHNEVTIKVDRKLVSDIYVADVDELLNYWDVRGEYARQQGQALSRVFDRHTLQLAVLAARATTPNVDVTGAPTGSEVTISTDSDGDTLVQGIFDAIVDFDERDIPVDMNSVSCVMRPAQYYEIVTSGANVMNRDFGGQGSIAAGLTGPIGELTIVKSNNLPQTDMSVGGGDEPDQNIKDGTNTDYFGDFTKTRGVVFGRDAVATVQLQALQYESDWKSEKQATLLIAKMMVGHGILRPEASTEIKLA